MNAETSLGLAAAVLTTSSYMPQVLKVWRTHTAHDLSIKMLVSLWAGLALWVVYGLLRSDPVLTLANGASFALVSFLIGFKAHTEHGA